MAGNAEQDYMADAATHQASGETNHWYNHSSQDGHSGKCTALRMEQASNAISHSINLDREHN